MVRADASLMEASDDGRRRPSKKGAPPFSLVKQGLMILSQSLALSVEKARPSSATVSPVEIIGGHADLYDGRSSNGGPTIHEEDDQSADHDRWSIISVAEVGLPQTTVTLSTSHLSSAPKIQVNSMPLHLRSPQAAPITLAQGVLGAAIDNPAGKLPKLIINEQTLGVGRNSISTSALAVLETAPVIYGQSALSTADIIQKGRFRVTVKPKELHSPQTPSGKRRFTFGPTEASYGRNSPTSKSVIPGTGAYSGHMGLANATEHYVSNSPPKEHPALQSSLRQRRFILECNQAALTCTTPDSGVVSTPTYYGQGGLANITGHFVGSAPPLRSWTSPNFVLNTPPSPRHRRVQSAFASRPSSAIAEGVSNSSPSEFYKRSARAAVSSQFRDVMGYTGAYTKSEAWGSDGATSGEHGGPASSVCSSDQVPNTTSLVRRALDGGTVGSSRATETPSSRIAWEPEKSWRSTKARYRTSNEMTEEVIASSVTGRQFTVTMKSNPSATSDLGPKLAAPADQGATSTAVPRVSSDPDNAPLRTPTSAPLGIWTASVAAGCGASEIQTHLNECTADNTDGGVAGSAGSFSTTSSTTTAESASTGYDMLLQGPNSVALPPPPVDESSQGSVGGPLVEQSPPWNALSGNGSARPPPTTTDVRLSEVVIKTRIATDVLPVAVTAVTAKSTIFHGKKGRKFVVTRENSL